MSGITETLGHQVGPLPLGAWVVVVGGGLGFALYSKRGSEGSGDASDDDGTLEVSQGVGETTGVFSGGSAGVSNPADGSSDGSIASPYDDQDSWGSAAIRVLIALGCDPVVAQQAISAYLAGAKMTISQHALVSTAMTKVGPPPQIPDNYDATPTPLPPVTKPAKYKYYTVKKKGMKLGDVARALGHGITWQTLWNANKSTVKRADGKVGPVKDHTKTLAVGTMILIP